MHLHNQSLDASESNIHSLLALFFGPILILFLHQLLSNCACLLFAAGEVVWVLVDLSEFV